MFAPEDATHQLMVVLRTPFGETIVADSDVVIDIQGGEIVQGQPNEEMDPGSMGMGEMGGMGGMGDMAGSGSGGMGADGGMGSGTMTNIRAFPGKHTLVVTVTANGTQFPVMTSEVDIPEPKDPPVIIPPEPPDESVDEPEETEPVEEPDPAAASTESGGCLSSGPFSGGGSMLWVAAGILGLLWRNRRAHLVSSVR